MTLYAQPLRSALLLLLSLMPVLAGCSGGLIPAPPKRDIYRVNPAVSFAGALPRVTAQLLVATPSASAALDSDRIALSRSAPSLDFYADAQWADRVPFLVQAALVQTFEKSRALPAVGPDNGGLHPDYVVDSEIRDFEAVYDSPDGAPRAVVRLQVKLVKMPERRIVAETSVGGEAPAASNKLPDVVQAFNGALGSTLRDLVTWTAGNPALSGRRR
jgi:cholesterol transport system auxiliary component